MYSRGKSIQAALADPDVTGVMDGGGLAAAKTCLFQSPIVWYSVIIVYIASQQPVSCVYYPFAKKKKKGKKEKRSMCFLSLSTRLSTE